MVRVQLWTGNTCKEFSTSNSFGKKYANLALPFREPYHKQYISRFAPRSILTVERSVARSVVLKQDLVVVRGIKH
jgi:hypothetical protein